MIRNKEEYLAKIHRAADYIKERIPEPTEICIVLGSGLGPLVEVCENVVTIDYKDIPGLPVTTAPGHKGCLLAGTLAGKRIYMMSGRFHNYEGYDPTEVVFYVRVMAVLGVKTFIMTNASGGIMDGLKPQSFMIIEDHISFLCESPLRGPNLEEFGDRFPDQSEVYDKEYRVLLASCCDDLGLNYRKGTYAYCRGPQYETPAEIRALKAFGAGCVGMSTVPEAITAVHCGMRVAAVAFISNYAAGLSDEKLSEEDILKHAAQISKNGCALITEFVKRL